MEKLLFEYNASLIQHIVDKGTSKYLLLIKFLKIFLENIFNSLNYALNFKMHATLKILFFLF